MRTIKLSEVLNSRRKPILIDEELDLKFYPYNQLKKRWAELDKVYSKLIRDRRKRKLELLQEFENLLKQSQTDTEDVKAKERREEIETELSAIYEEEQLNLVYNLAPVCEKTYEELLEILTTAADGDTALATGVIISEIYDLYLAALEDYDRETKKRQEDLGIAERVKAIAGE